MRSILSVLVKVLFLVAVSEVAFAGLPDSINPTNVAEEGNYISNFKGFAHDILIVGGLILGTIAFLVVAFNCITVYSEIGAGKKNWGDLGMHGGIGVLLLVLVIYLLNEASQVIFLPSV